MGIEIPNEIINNTLADGDEVRENYDFLALLLGGTPQGTMLNGYIETSISNNDLVVAIKTIAGLDPSVSDPVYVRIGNEIRSITAALSVTAADATNWCNAGATELATQEIDYFVYLAWEASANAVRIGFSRIPSGRIYDDFSATSTNEKYAKWNNAPGAGDECEVIGRFNAILSAGATYTWTLPATSIVISRPIYKTRWLTWVPTWTGFSVNPTTGTYQYKVDMDDIKLNVAGGNGTSNATSFTFTLPFNSLDLSLLVVRGVDNGAAVGACAGLIPVGSNIVTLNSNFVTGTWTASGTKRIDRISSEYNI